MILVAGRKIGRKTDENFRHVKAFQTDDPSYILSADQVYDPTCSKT